MKPSTWRRVSAALVVAAFACTFMVATGGASRVRQNPLEQATRVAAKKHCAMYRSKRAKKRSHHRRICKSYKRGLTPLVPPAHTSGVSEGDTGATGSTGTTGPDRPCEIRYGNPDAPACMLAPPCNALPSPEWDASGTTGPWGSTGPEGPNIPWWAAIDRSFVGDPYGCSGDRAQQWADMPSDPTVMFGDAGVQESGPAYSNGPGIARFVARVVDPGAPGAELRVQYSTDKSAWTYLDGANGPALPIGAAGLKVSDWVEAPSVMYTTAHGYHPFYARVVGSGGDGVTDPSFSGVALQGWFPGSYYVP